MELFRNPALLSLLCLLTFCCTAQAVVNGTTAPPNAYRFIASLQWDGRHKCGGTLIDAQTVLTAAHCIPLVFVNPDEPQRASALLGAWNQSQPTNTSVRVGIAGFLPHPELKAEYLNWSTIQSMTLTQLTYDYALLRLAEPVRPSRSIQYGRLAESSMPRPNDECTILGWGRYQYPDTDELHAEIFSGPLRQGRMRVMSERNCTGQRQPPAPHTMVCLAPIFRQQKSQGMLCFGDSGSPMVCRDPAGRQYVAGMAEAAMVPCNHADLPAIAMRVDNVKSWIEAERIEKEEERDEGHPCMDVDRMDG